jgi:uncharacterized protein
MLHPDTQLRYLSTEVGHGVFATAAIPRGTIVWVRDCLDQEFTREQLSQLPAVYQTLVRRYTFLTAAGTNLLCWDGGRLMNHSCQPSCAGTHLGFEMAIRDLEPGAELTNDYATLSLTEEEFFSCNCHSPVCRGLITSEASSEIASSLVMQLRAVLPLALTLPQPLWPLVNPAQVCQAFERLALPRPARLAMQAESYTTLVLP